MQQCRIQDASRPQPVHEGRLRYSGAGFFVRRQPVIALFDYGCSCSVCLVLLSFNHGMPVTPPDGTLSLCRKAVYPVAQPRLHTRAWLEPYEDPIDHGHRPDHWRML